MTKTTAPSISVSDARRVLSALDDVAADARKRADALSAFVDMTRDALDNPEAEGMTADEAVGIMTTLGYFQRAMEALDTATIIDPPGRGSTDGSNVRRARTALASMLAGEVPQHLY